MFFGIYIFKKKYICSTATWGRFLFSVLRVLRVFWYLYFQEKIYIYTYHLRHRHMGPRGFLVERRSSENHGVHGVQKMDDAKPANAMSRCHCQGGVCFFVERRSSENHGVHGVQKMDDVAGRRTTHPEADAQPTQRRTHNPPRGGRTTPSEVDAQPPERRTHNPPGADAQPPQRRTHNPLRGGRTTP